MSCHYSIMALLRLSAEMGSLCLMLSVLSLIADNAVHIVIVIFLTQDIFSYYQKPLRKLSLSVSSSCL